MIPTLTKAKQYISTCSHWLSQKLAIYALSPEGLRIAEGVRLELKANRDWVQKQLQKGLPNGISEVYYPPASPYLLFKTSDPPAFCSSAATKGVIMVPGQAFGKVSSGWVRVNIGVDQILLQRAFQHLA